MARPAYETKKDRKNERQVVSTLSNSWNCVPKKLSPKYEMDFALCREGGGNWNERFRIQAFVEIKCRTVKQDQYDTNIIGIEKWLKGCDLFAKTGIPCYLIYKFTDALTYFEFNPKYVDYINITMGGRKDRGDPKDQEPVVHIPNYMMNKI